MKPEKSGFFRLKHTSLLSMALFDLNTGARDEVVCGLKWDNRGQTTFIYKRFRLGQSQGPEKTKGLQLLNCKPLFIWCARRDSNS